MFLYVLAVIGYTAGCYAGFSHELKTDLPAQVIWNLPLLQTQNNNDCKTLVISFIHKFCQYLSLFIYLREELIHVHQKFILNRAQEMTSLQKSYTFKI